MNVQVTEWYVPGCPECIAIVEPLAASAVRDATVTKLTISAGHQHCHPHEKQEQKRVGAGAPTPSVAPAPTVEGAPSGVLFTDAEVAAFTGDLLPNGYDPRN